MKSAVELLRVVSAVVMSQTLPDLLRKPVF